MRVAESAAAGDAPSSPAATNSVGSDKPRRRSNRMPTSLLASPIQILLVVNFTVTRSSAGLFPARSVAAQALCLVFPSGNILPEDGLQITSGDGSSASDTVTLKETEFLMGL